MIPKYLYKFEKLNLQTVRNLKNAQIYFNTPANFNDPFDCSALDVSAMLTDEKVVEIFKKSLRVGSAHVDFDIDSIKNVSQIFKQIYPMFEKKFLEKQDEILNRRGCTCFSETKDDILLWSHYAEGHKGMCLEFDTSHSLFSRARKVDYSLEFPPIDPTNMLFGSDKESLEENLKLLFTKYKCWSYEKEWRLFHEEPNKMCGYSEALKSVYFGLSVNSTDREIVCLTLQGQNKDVKFYQAKKDKSRYSLSFEEFT